MQSGFNFEPLTPTAFLHRAAQVFPDRVGVVDGSLKFTYGEFLERALKFAGALKALGVKPGDRVAVLAGNSHVMLAAHYAVPFAGARARRAQYAHHAGRHGVSSCGIPARRCSIYDQEFAAAAAAAGDAGRIGDCGSSGRAAQADELEGADRRRHAVVSHAGRRRALAARDQLHQRHDRAAEGRHVPPSRRVPAGARDGAAHGARQRLRATSGRCRCSTATAGAFRGR